MSAVSAIGEMVEEERHLLTVPTAAESLAALDAIQLPLRSLQAALKDLDEFTSDALDAHAWKDGDTVAALRESIASWENHIDAAAAQQRKRKAARVARQIEITRRLQRIFLAHRILFAASPSSKAAAVLGIVLSELGLPSTSPGNYVREVLRQGVKPPPQKGTHLH